VNKFIKIIFVGIVSSVGIYLAFSGEDINLILLEFKKVNLMGVLVASIILVFSCVIRAYRWRLLLNPFAEISITNVFSATMIGYFGNGVFAFRLGELLKAYSVSINTNLNISKAFGTVILERMIDLIMVLIFSLFFLPWFPDHFYQIKITIYLIFGLIISLCLFIVFSIKLGLFRRIKKNNYFKKIIKIKVFSYFFNIYEGILAIKNTDYWRGIIISSLVLWFIYYGITLILLKSCSIELNIFDSGILFVLGSLAIGIPALPGSIGTYDAAIKYILMIIFSINSLQALNYAIISHAVSYFPLTIIGAFYFIFGSVSMKSLKNLD